MIRKVYNKYMSQRTLLVALLVLVILSAGFTFVYVRAKSPELAQNIPSVSETQDFSTPSPIPNQLIGILCGPGQNGGPNICPDGYVCNNAKVTANGKEFPGTCVLPLTPAPTKP